MGNDMTILYGIIILFIAIGALLPLVQADLNTTASTAYSPNTIYTTSKEGLETESGFWGTAPGLWQTLKSIVAMFFWTFGGLPFYVDLFIFIPLRLLAFGIIARNIWVGGGG